MNRRVQTIPAEENSFSYRKSILPNCVGLRDEELSTKSGIENCIFVHTTGFIGGNKTREGALEMAVKSL